MERTEQKRGLRNMNDQLRVVAEEVIFEGFDKSWRRNLPVRLLTYGDGQIDLHRQSGSEFHAHMEEARRILAARGLVASEPEVIASTGIYMRVSRAPAMAASAAHE